MTFIKKVRNGKNTYYYLVKSVREGNSVKHKIIEYYGTHDPTTHEKNKKLEQMPFGRINITNVYSAGPLLCIVKLMNDHGLCTYIDETFKKRQGIPAGFTLFTTAAHKLFGFDPSLNNLPKWLEDTPLRINDKIDVTKFNCDNINYIFDLLFTKHGAVEELENIQSELFNLAKQRFNINEKNLYYDVTSAYFEGDMCDCAEHGYSREHRSDKKQINIGLVATKDRKFPVFTKVFRGNISDKATVIEIVTTMKHIYKFKDITAIMDRGMISEDNIMVLDANEYDYILGASSALKIIDELLMKVSKKKIVKNGVVFHTKKGCVIHAIDMNKTIYGKRRKVVVAYNVDMAADQIETMMRKIEQAEDEYRNHVHTINKSTINQIEKIGSPFVKMIEKEGTWTFELDPANISRAKKKAGKSALLTTLDDSSDKILAEYFEKYIIERIFRFSKQYASLRPLRRRIPQRVKIDVFLSFLGYYIIAFIRELLIEKGINVTDEELISEIPKIRLVVKCDAKKGTSEYNIVGNSDLQKSIIDALELDKSVDNIKKLVLQ